MSRKQNLAQALQNVSGKADTNQSISTPTVPVEKNENTVIPPSRVGKKAITGFFDPAVSKQFKRLALDNDKTVQLLLAEALNDLFVKHNQMPIA